MVGCALLERGSPGHPVRLTPAGEAFYGHALGALARLRAGALDAAAATRAGDLPPLRLGTYPSVAARLLPSLLDRLRAERPQAELALREAAGPDELEQAVEAGELDLAFSVQPFGRPGLTGVPLREDPYCLLVPRDSPLADRTQPVRLGELAELPLVLSGTCRHLRHLEARLRLHGHDPLICVHTDDDGLAHELVAAGRGCAVIGRLQLDPRRDDTIAVELADVVPPRIIALAWAADRPLPELAENFVAWAAETLGAHSPPTRARARPTSAGTKGDSAISDRRAGWSSP